MTDLTPPNSPAQDDGKHDSKEFSIRRFNVGQGDFVRVGGNIPVRLDDPERAWLIQLGHVDIFAAPLLDGERTGARTFLFRAEAGQMLFGVDTSAFAGRLTLIGVGIQGTRLQAVQVSALRAMGVNPDYSVEIAVLLESWIKGLSTGLVRELTLRLYEPLDPENTTPLDAQSIARARKGVVWMRVQQGELHFASEPDFPLQPGTPPTPVTERTWAQAVQRSIVQTFNTETLLESQPDWMFLRDFHQLALRYIVQNLTGSDRIEVERLKNRRQQDDVALSGALDNLASIMDERAGIKARVSLDGDEPLVTACRMVGAALGVKIIRRPDPIDGKAEAQTLDTIARSSRVGVRQVRLKGIWWQEDSGPVLAYRQQTLDPVALLPAGVNRYLLRDPLTGQDTPVTAEVARTLAPVGHTFYRSFPFRAVNAWDMLRFGLFGNRRDLLLVLAMGMAGGLLGIIVPVFTGIIIDTVIPAARRDQLVQLSALLLVAAVAAALFQITRTFAVLRLEIKMDASIQAAVWDRLLNLPVPFFRSYTAGDLAERALGVSTIRRALSGTVVLSLLSGIFSVFSFLLLFALDVQLALLATGMVAVSVVITLLAGVAQLRFQRALAHIQGRIAGMVLQFITAVSKLRVAAAEQRAFALWANAFSDQKRMAYRAGVVENLLQVFNAIYPILTAMILYAAVAGTVAPERLSTGAFIAFFGAFTQFLFAGLQLSGAFITLLTVVPVYERLKPILDELPEVDEAKADPGTLSGDIEVNRVSFRYREGGVQVLQDVTFHIKPGEFVAIVGQSGSGKSTLFRQLLGFEKPEAGVIFYDGQDLSGLDIRAVRQQMGVVLQNSQLMSGDIFTNIVGVSDLTLEDAWEAARMAGVDEDIRTMPMGMHTIISEGGGTLSGGQRQRLLIARAIASNPRILFFDEATSALDNRTQEQVSRSLENLDATRVVIAHRLSTIMNADRILVLDGGRIVQSGTYQELMQHGGLFAELARRQLV